MKGGGREKRCRGGMKEDERCRKVKEEGKHEKPEK